MRFLICLLFPFLAFAQKDYTALVNPFIGTGGHGHTFPGATLPYGMVQLSPDTRMADWDGSSGYHYSDKIIYGFSHTHLSGTGVPDYCDVLMQPVTGGYWWKKEDYCSAFSHASETASPGYYAVKLDRFATRAELTATTRTGLHRYTYPTGIKEGHVLIDLKHRDQVLMSSLKIENDSTVSGKRISKSWAKEQHVYFVIRYSKPMARYMIALNGSEAPDMNIGAGTDVKAYLSFDVKDGKPLLAKVGISGVSVEGALKNLEAEQPGFDFEGTVAAAKAAWNKELGKIEIKGGTADRQTVFYTALYHASLQPNIYMDVDGQYRGTDLKIHQAEGFVNHTVFSLWDTYRAWHPLMTILNQRRTNDWINTFLAQYRQGGMLPVWELSGCETFCMIGYHSVPVMADAWQKGIRGFDGALALKAMKDYAESKRFGLEHYIRDGYLANDREHESVSKTLEYAYDDWCIAQFAREQGAMADYETYMMRAQSYRNMFDPQTGHVRGRTQAMWYAPFDAREINNYFTEGNSWQYSFAAPHDLAGLIRLYGGKEKMAAKLNELFTTSSVTTGRNQSDVTGLIGQYAQGNEPSHHMAYLFNYVGQPWRTQEYVHKICREFYLNTPDGLIGNEDCGQMSAWYLFSAMGFYPVCPGNGEYIIGTPEFDEVKINLENGKTFTITANRRAADNYYVQGLALNGKNLSASYIRHTDIMNGGGLAFELGPEPNKTWAVAEKDLPYTGITGRQAVLVPYFKNESNKFKGETLVSLASAGVNDVIYYRVEVPGGPPSHNLPFMKYSGPFKINKSCKIWVYGANANGESPRVGQDFFKIRTDRSISIQSQVHSMYTAGGPDALIDGITGTTNWRTGEWQSYYNTDFNATIHLKKLQPVKTIGVHVLQDLGPWILYPKEVIIETSADGKKYNLAGSIKNTVANTDEQVQVQEMLLKVNLKARYIRIRAISGGPLPASHESAGSPSHLFIDEVLVRD